MVDWDKRDKLLEAQCYLSATKELCQVMEMQSTIEIPKSVFLIFEVVCEKIHSLLSALDDTEQ